VSQTCAIYTRKSTEEGLEQDFNSLHAQREACEAYIASQKTLGWKLLATHYDDGGYSGGTLQRPALQRLLQDVDAGRVKTIVVYKVDRLTRSLADFAKLVERFDAQGVSFVSVTQQFNTTTSMGRLTLNVLLSFAQFEREVTGERIRDKIAASKRKGMWMGGVAPIGYRVQDKQLLIDPPQAERVREIYRLYRQLGCVRQLKQTMDEKDWRTPARSTQRADAQGQGRFTRGHLYRILSSPIYVGRVPHKDQAFDGLHEAIVNQELWLAVQRQLKDNIQGQRVRPNARDASLLAGMVCDSQGQRAKATHAQKQGKRYRYYILAAAETTVPAVEIEEAVIRALKEFLQDEARLVQAIGRVSVAQATNAIARSRDLHEALLGDRTTLREALITLLTQVNVNAQSIELVLDLKALIEGADAKHTLQVPFARQRVGMAVRLVVQGSTPARAPDQRMVALLLKAYGWLDRLFSDEKPGVDAIAKSEGLGGSHVTRVLQLAFLAPDLVQAIAEGRHPVGLGADRLLDVVPLDDRWEDQRVRLGFATRVTHPTEWVHGRRANGAKTQEQCSR
jgi:site-specific DNA recombinase